MTSLKLHRVLNVGGNSKEIAIPAYYNDFEHVIADIDASVNPDLLIDARELHTTDANQFDAIYCSHNLEHFFAHDVPKVLKGFQHVLKDEGFAEVRVPDLAALMREMIQKGLDLDDVLYKTKVGYPITARDVFYGWGHQIEHSGEDFYAHKTGFSPRTLCKALNEAGFPIVILRPGRRLEIFALAFQVMPTEFQKELLQIKIKD